MISNRNNTSNNGVQKRGQITCKMLPRQDNEQGMGGPYLFSTFFSHDQGNQAHSLMVMLQDGDNSSWPHPHISRFCPLTATVKKWTLSLAKTRTGHSLFLPWGEQVAESLGCSLFPVFTGKRCIKSSCAILYKFKGKQTPLRFYKSFRQNAICCHAEQPLKFKDINLLFMSYENKNRYIYIRIKICFVFLLNFYVTEWSK